MKLRAIVLGSLLFVLCSATSGNALRLDYPHNVDNGIKCYHCHSEDPYDGADLWWDGYTGPDPDGSIYNWICYNRCHAGTASSYYKVDPNSRFLGPEKLTHSTTTTGSQNYSFTTECIACHDPHFQEQIRWHATDVIYVATGTYTGPAALDSTEDPLTNPNGLGVPGIGAYVVRVVLDPTPIYDPVTEDWASKGGKGPDPITGGAWKERAVDHSRGLILVENTDAITTTHTFEIVKMTNFSGSTWDMMVKGNPTDAANTIPFGVIYGNLLADKVKTPETYLDAKNIPRNVRRPVKFFSTKSVAGGAGGPADLTPSATEPVGMCQVCHTMTSSYKSTVEETAHHNADGRTCDECHQLVTGGEPVVTHAPTFIDIGLAVCADVCHVGYGTDPDQAHIGAGLEVDCKTCHTDTAPYLNANTEIRVPYTSDGTLHAAVACTTCHDLTYGGVDYTNSLAHPDATQEANKDTKHNAAIAPQSLCVSACHGTLLMVSNGVAIVENSDAPVGGHADNCSLCHLTVTPPVELTAGAAVAQTNLPAATDCGGCHTAYFGGHTHNHALSVVVNSSGTPNTVNCNGCHTAPAGNGPFVATGEPHNPGGCNTCHLLDGGSPDGSLRGSANGANISGILADSAYECGECHVAHFDSHSHVHGVTFNATVDKTTGGSACNVCHRDYNGLATSLDTWAGIIHEHDAYDGLQDRVNVCEVCHNYTTNGNRSGDPGTPLAATVATVITSGLNVTCRDCHVKKNTESHGSHIDTEFAWTTATRTSCGDDGRAIGACHADGANTDVIVDIHGDGLDGRCALCHVDVATNQYGRIAGTDGDATTAAAVANGRNAICTDCHTTLNHSKPFIHHANNGTVIYTPATECASRCHNTANSAAGNHTALVADVAPCLSCHTATKGSTDNVPVSAVDDKVHDACTQCHVINPTTKMVELVPPSGSVTTMDNPIGSATNDGGGPCSDCHTTYFDDHNHTHTLTSVVNPCEGCHVATASPFVGSSEVHYNAGNGCATCHNLGASPTGLLIVGSSAEGAIGTENCQGCHTGYFDSHSHGHTGITVAVSCGTADCHDGAGPNSNARFAANPPYLNTGEVHDTLTCGNCHDLTPTGSGQPKAGTSAANWGLSWSTTPSGNCETCHNAGVFATTHDGLTATELNTLHGTGNAGAPVVSENAGCMVCHDGVGSSAAKTASNTTRPYLATGALGQVHAANGCATCHQTSGAIISPAPALAPLLSAAGGDCVACHDAYFDSHTHHANPATNDFTQDPLVDLSYAAPGQTCGNASGTSCHHDYDDDDFTSPKYPDLSEWITIQWEHDRTAPKDGLGACITCHNGDNSVRTSSIVTGYASVRAVVRDKAAVHCLDCHTDKETPWVHGLTHVDHLLVNNTDQSTLGWIPIIEDTECATCHVVVASYADDGGLDAIDSPGDVVIDMHRNACGLCHVSQPELKTVPNFAQFAQTNLDGVYCVECHQAAIPLTYLFHDMLSTQTQVVARHDLLGDSGSALNGPADCMACHAEMVDVSNVTKKLDRHQTCEKCHTTSGLAVTVIADGSESAATPTNQPCENCHNIKDDLLGGPGYRLHGLTGDAGLDGVAVEHNNLAASGANDCSASGCHTMSNATEKMALHVKGCLTCHAPAALGIVNPDPDGPVDTLAQVDKGLPLSNDGYPAGSNLPVTCDNCHVQVGSFNMHGLDNATSASVHDMLAGSSTLSPGSAEDCETCHAAGTFKTRLDLHKGGCAMCHGVATAPAITAISNGIAGTPINCETCHGDAKPNAYYTMHAMTENDVATAGIHENISTVNSGFAGNDDCAKCHAMGTQADMLRIHMSAPVKQNPPHTGDCLTCHTVGGKAATSITNGTSVIAGGGGLVQTCFNCHELENDYSLHSLTVVGIAPVHDKLALPAGATSNCASGAGACHVITTILDRITIHTNATTTCVACHSWNDTMNAAIATGFNGVPANVGCEKCHDGAAGSPVANPPNIAGDWYAHLDPGHAALVLVNTDISTNAANCVVCHDEPNIIDAGQPGVGIHDMSDDPDAKYSCKICHGANSALIGSGSGKTGGECITCHGNGLPYFDSHLHVHDVMQDPTDLSGTDLCSVCHNGNNADGNGIPLDSWADIESEHETGCASCHDYVDDGQGTPTALANYTQIDSTGIVKCLDCHTAKTAGHGGHDPAHFDWTAATITSCGAAACHDSTSNTNVVASLHANSCAMCHPTSGGRDGGKLGANEWGDARLATTAFGSLGDLTDDCVVCHNVSIAVSGSVKDRLYGSDFANAHAVVAHDLFTSTAGCATTSCHQGDIITAIHDEGVDDGATYECLLCHVNLTTNGAPKLAARGDATKGHGDCLNCHGAVGNFNYDTQFQTAHQIKDHSDLATTASCITSGCHTGDYVTAVHDEGADNGATYECLLCHVNLTDNGALKSGLRGDATQGSGTCVTCHGATGGFNYDSAFETAHQSKDHDGVTSTGANCSSSCHDGSSGPNIVNNSHTDCLSCHVNITNNGALVGAATYGTAVNSGSCNDCHAAPADYVNNFNVHTRLTDHDGVTLGATGCDSCHPGDLITAVHDEGAVGGNYSCLLCHTNLTTTGTFVPLSSAENAGLGVKDCSTCHGSGHDAELDHNNIHKTWTTANKATEDCYPCHGQMGGETVVFKDIGSGGIDQLHNRGNVTCNSCHAYSGGRTGTPALNVTNAIDTGKSTGSNLVVNCESCHVYNDITSHDAINAHNRTMLEIGNYEREGLSCGRCHHGNVAIEHVMGGAYCTNLTYTDQATCESNGFFWNANWGVAKGKIELWTTPPGNKCTICHDDGAGGPASNAVVDAAVTLGKSTGSDLPVGCYECHQPSNPELFHYDPDNGGPLVVGNAKYGAGYDIPKGHHDGTQVLSGNCVYCHTDPRANPDLNFPTPAVLPCRNCHAVEDDAGQQLTIYRERNRGQAINWNGAKITGAGTWTLTFDGICADTTYADQTTCETAGLDWRPARAVANTEPSGTCSVGAGIYTDKKWDCINIGGGKWTYDEQPGTGVAHQWTIFSGRGGLGGAVQTYGMCIFCHKMAPYHALRLTTDDYPTAGAITGLRYGVCSTSMETPRVDYGTEAACTAAGGTWAKGASAVLDVNYLDGFVSGAFHPGPGRSELAVMHEVSAYEDNYYHAGTYDDAAKDDYKGIWQGIATADGVPDVSLSYAMAVYQPQQVCSDPRWKNSNGGQTKCESTLGVWNSDSHTCSDLRWTNQVDCEGNVGNWDHGDQAKKYIPSWWIGGAEAEYARVVPVIESAPATVTITNNGTSFTEVGIYEYGSGSSFSFNVNVTTCTDATCSVYAVVAGQDYPLTYQGGTNWTAASGAIQGYWPAGGPHEGENRHIGSVRGAVDVHYVAVKNNPGNPDHRQTLGYLNVTKL